MRHTFVGTGIEAVGVKVGVHSVLNVSPRYLLVRLETLDKPST